MVVLVLAFLLIPRDALNNHLAWEWRGESNFGDFSLAFLISTRTQYGECSNCQMRIHLFGDQKMTTRYICGHSEFTLSQTSARFYL